jgi:phosphatidylserine/phosphatidylglycerophosphate/cardiolipin synthase-like enzyme
VPDRDRAAIVATLASLVAAGLTPAQLAIFLRVLASERAATQRAIDRTTLVWTGPEVAGATSRDTQVVVRELFAGARRHVLVACYALYQSKKVLEPLATAMDAWPELSVRMFVHVGRPHGDAACDAELLRRFAATFQVEHWPGRHLPELFYDPRALAAGYGPKACMHAKCIVVDDARAFVTSANFTEAAQDRNIEAGVLVDDAVFAASLRGQFETLVTLGCLKRIPGMSERGP